MISRGHDPYAPHGQLVAEVRLPQVRLRHAGADDDALAQWRKWWLALDTDGRRVAQRRLIALTYPQLTELVATVAGFAGSSGNSIERDVAASPDPTTAAGLAVTMELGRPRPRVALLRKLGGRA